LFLLQRGIIHVNGTNEGSRAGTESSKAVRARRIHADTATASPVTRLVRALQLQRERRQGRRAALDSGATRLDNNSLLLHSQWTITLGGGFECLRIALLCQHDSATSRFCLVDSWDTSYELPRASNGSLRGSVLHGHHFARESVLHRRIRCMIEAE